MMQAKVKDFLSSRGIRRMLWVALILSFSLAAWNELTSYTASDKAMYLRISIKTPESAPEFRVGTLFYDTGQGYNAKEMHLVYIPRSDQFQDLKLGLPVLKTIHHLRFDPPSTKTGEIVINRIELIKYSKWFSQRLDLKHVRPLQQIKQFSLDGGEVRFRIDEPGTDPQIDLGIDGPISVDRFQFMWMMFSDILLEGAGIFVICVFLIFVWSCFTDKTNATLVVLALLAAGWLLHQEIQELRKGAVSASVKVSMISDTSGSARLYYDRGRGLNEADSEETEILKGEDIHNDDAFIIYTFKIRERFFRLRFDPLNGEGTIRIRKIEITDPSGKVVHTVPHDDLRPISDIKTIEKRGEDLVVVMNKNAKDPQINILNVENVSQNLAPTFSLQVFLLRILISWSLIGFCLLVGIITRKKYGRIISRSMDGSFFQQKLHLCYLGCALALVLAMAMISNLQANPDEMGHDICAAYYVKNWLPPAIDDEAVLKTFSGHGVSYLFRVDIVYFLAGKASILMSGMTEYPHLNLRLFNVLLFGLLVIIAIRRTPISLIFVLGLVATPQLWYVFSYFNGDAFAACIAFLLAAQVMNDDSLSGRYLNGSALQSRLSGGLLLGILIGLMLLSKANYYVYLVFIAFILVLRLFFDSDLRLTDRWPLQMKKGLLIGGIALCISLPIFCYDQYVNDFQKGEKIGQFVEKNALYPFKPSTAKNKPAETHSSIYLRDKGLKLRNLFLENDEWRQMSFKSFFGVYSYMTLYSSWYHYKMISLLLAGMTLFLIFYSAYHSLSFQDTLILLSVLFFSLLTIGQSVYFSWTADYQPQGRYLFPIIPIVLVGLSRLPDIIKQRFVPCFSLCFFLLSLSSFVFTALLSIHKMD